MTFSAIGRRGAALPFPNQSLQQESSYFIITPPETTAVSLLEVKAYLKIDGTDDDAILTLMIGAASNRFEEYTNRTLINTGWETFVDFFTMAIELRKSKFQALNAFEYLVDGAFTAVPSTDFYTTKESDYNRVVFNTFESMPQNKDDRLQSVRIQFTAGFGAASSDVPAAIRIGLLSHIAAMNENRGDCSQNDCACVAIPPGAKLVYDQYQIVSLGGVYRGGGGLT